MYFVAFWKSWHPRDRFPFLALAVLVSLAVLYLAYAAHRAPAPVVRLETYQERLALPIVIDTLRIGGFSVEVPATSAVVIERQQPGEWRPNVRARQLYGGILFICWIGLVAVVSTLPRLPMALGAAGLIGVLVSLRLNSFYPDPSWGDVPVWIAALAYGVPLLYFLFNRAASYIVRFLVFAAVTVGLLVLLHTTSVQPVGFLTVHAVPAALVGILVFSGLIGHEIIAFFLWAIGQGRPTRSLFHFLLAALIYLLNLGLLWASLRNWIDWNIVPAGVLVLLVSSLVLGVWGFRQQRVQYEGALADEPVAGFLFLWLSLLAVSSLAFFWASYNDMWLEAVPALILYPHMGFGIIFIVYIISNFILLLAGNYAVYKVLYKPNTMPFFTFRLGGLIATIAFFSYSNWGTLLSLVSAGTHNALGDWALSVGDTKDAEARYQRSLLSRQQNHQAHYVLGNAAESRLELSRQTESYQRAARGNPSVAAYLKWSEGHRMQGQPYQSLLALYEAKARFPKELAISEALGLQHVANQQADSALYYFARAAARGGEARARMNWLAACARFGVALPIDSLLLTWDADEEGLLVNGLAIANRQHHSLNIPFVLPRDTVLTLFSAARIVNHLLNERDGLSSADLENTIALARKPSNQYFREWLLGAVAAVSYQIGHVRLANDLLRELAYTSGRPEHSVSIAIGQLQQGSYDRAWQRLTESPHARLQLVTLTLQKDRQAVLRAIDSLRHQQTLNSETAELEAMWKAAEWSSTFTERQTLWYTMHRLPLGLDEVFASLISPLPDNLKAEACLYRSRQYLEAEEPGRAMQMLVRLNTLQIQNRQLKEEVRLFSLLLLVNGRQWPAVRQQLTQVKSPDRAEVLYAQAALAYEEGNPREGWKKLKEAFDRNPFLEEVVLAAAVRSSEEGATAALTYLTDGLLAQPSSVRLLKAYTIKAAELGYLEEAQDTIDRLQQLLTPPAMEAFVRSRPDLFGKR